MPFSVVVDVAALSVAVAGLAFGLSLIVAIGPQNTFVIRAGLRRQHLLLVVSICAVSDVLAIAAGAGGAGAVLAGRRWLAILLGATGAAFLVGYAGLALRRALNPSTDGLPAATQRPAATRAGVALTALALTWLNPGVYVDTVLVIGPVAHSHGSRAWDFAGGAMLASLMWFVALGYGAFLLAPLFSRPAAWRVLDSVVAVILLATAVRLVTAL